MGGIGKEVKVEAGLNLGFKKNRVKSFKGTLSFGSKAGWLSGRGSNRKMGKM